MREVRRELSRREPSCQKSTRRRTFYGDVIDEAGRRPATGRVGRRLGCRARTAGLIQCGEPPHAMPRGPGGLSSRNAVALTSALPLGSVTTSANASLGSLAYVVSLAPLIAAMVASP